MHSVDINLLEKKLNEIHDLIKEAIQIGHISDKKYEAIKERIGKIDEYHLQVSLSNPSNARFSELINQADEICKTLDNAKKSDNEASAHHLKTTGDYFKDDNSFTLSPTTKKALQAILSQKQ